MLTENQRRLVDMAKAKRPEWVCVEGVCMAGTMSGRGRATVIKSLVKRGLIESRLRSFGRGAMGEFIRYKGNG